MDPIVKRINELARKFKAEGLTEAETAERETLRQQYIRNFRQNFRQQLDQIEFTDEPPIRH